MTDYKLMPKQITKEMADAFWEEYSKDRADDLLMRCYKAMYTVAPQLTMQGELIGYIRRSALELMKNDELGIRANIIKEPRYQDCVALYAAPADEAMRLFISRVERIAMSMKAPNIYTPQLMEACVAMRAALCNHSK